MWYCHHELCYTSPRTFFFSLCTARQFEALASLSRCSRTKCFCMGCWIAFVDPRSTIKVEWYTFCPEICGQFFALISKFQPGSEIFSRKWPFFSTLKTTIFFFLEVSPYSSTWNFWFSNSFLICTTPF